MESVLSLLNHDLLKHQPTCTEKTLLDTLAGRIEMDAHLWQKFYRISTFVIETGNSASAFFAFAQSETDSSADLLWLHAKERKDLLQACVDYTLETLERRQILAFRHSSPLTSGFEGLPISRRPATSQVLAEAGFMPCSLWTYMSKTLDGQQREARAHSITMSGDAPYWRLAVEKAAMELGHIEIQIIGTTGVILYFFVDESARRSGIANSLMARAEQLLSANGANSLVLAIDDDLLGPRNRSAAKALCHSRGYEEVDQLRSFELLR